MSDRENAGSFHRCILPYYTIFKLTSNVGVEETSLRKRASKSGMDTGRDILIVVSVLAGGKPD